MKPQWLALPTLVLVGRDRRMVLPIIGAIVSIVILPFALVGFNGIGDYIGLVTERGTGDVTDPAFSSAIRFSIR